MTFQPEGRGYDTPVMLRTLLLVASVLMCLPLAPAGAQVAEGVVTASLLPGWRTARGTHMAALHLSLRDGWKTYWRAPGEGGIPPQFDWGGSQNARSVRIHWPTPEVFEANGMQSIGYGGTLVLPLEVATDDPGAPVVLAAAISLGVCEVVCVPVSLSLSAELPPGEARRDRRILAAIGDRPETGAEAGAREVRCRVEPIADGLRIRASMVLPVLGDREVAVFELPDRAIWISPSTTRRAGERLFASAEMVPPDARPFALSRSDVRITVLSDRRAVSIRGCAG